MCSAHVHFFRHHKRTAPMIIRLAEGTLKTRFGTYTQILYYDG
jgi:hypothetical protein